MWGLAPLDHCQSSAAAGAEHTTHRGSQSRGERKYKEGSSDRSGRTDTDIFLDLFCGSISSMVPTSTS